jgi:hypothetical protein
MGPKTLGEVEIGFRLEKVLLLRAQIQAGVYRVSTDDLAQRMLQACAKRQTTRSQTELRSILQDYT